jgi:lysophospholipase L1-like esterase
MNNLADKISLKFLVVMTAVLASPWWLMEGSAYLINTAYQNYSGISEYHRIEGEAQNALMGSKGVQIAKDFKTWGYSKPFVYDAYPMYRNREYASQTLNIDAKHRRINGRSYDSPHYKGGSEIWAFGSSALFGYPVNADNETITAHLEKMLNGNSNSQNSKVINYSTPHYFVNSDLVLLNRFLAEGRKPGAIVLFNGYNDVLGMFMCTTFSSPIAGRAFSTFWDMHENGQILYMGGFSKLMLDHFHETKMLLRRVTKVLALMIYKLSKDKFIESVRDQINAKYEQQKSCVSRGYRQYVSHLESIWQIASARGIRVISIFQPAILFTSKSLSPEEQIIWNSYIRTHFPLSDDEIKTATGKRMLEVTFGLNREHMKNVFLRLNSEVMNISKKYKLVTTLNLKPLIDRENESIFTDHVHLTNRGNQVVAKAIFGGLKHAGWPK